MAELTEEERQLIELMRRDEARQDALPESERAHSSRPDRFGGWVGADDEGRMFPNPRPPASPEQEAAHQRELIHALQEREKAAGKGRA